MNDNNQNAIFNNSQKQNLSDTEMHRISRANEIEKLRKSSEENYEKFWSEQANQLEWFRPWDTVFQWDFPDFRWFDKGIINVSHNCLDRHLSGSKKNKAALIWEGETLGDVRTYTYLQLQIEVSKFANVLKKLGVKKGDVVGIYLGMIPEAVVAMLACTRIGAVHNVVFGGFSADALRERMNDSKASVLITQDAAKRRGAYIELKAAADLAAEKIPTLRDIVVIQHSGVDILMKSGRDHWYHDLMLHANKQCSPEYCESEDPLFILYTSGSTGKPKGLLHTTGGYLAQVHYTTKLIFDLTDSDTYFCTADIGWITGHSYIVYGPLSVGATILLYEGAIDCPNIGRCWDIVERHKVTVFYTAPTAIRAFMKAGDGFPLHYDLSSLRLLGSVGEPINPEVWAWYDVVIGKSRSPIVDTWWQTETGAILISPIPGVTSTKPGSATFPLPGILADIVRTDGTPCEPNESGFLVISKPFPSMARTIFGDKERYIKTYWSEFLPVESQPPLYFSGDGARKDSDGYYWLLGRVDDVVNVSGHRLGTAEIESALVSHPSVAEAAVVARQHEVKGHALVAFVCIKNSIAIENKQQLCNELALHVAKEIGSIAKPDEVRIASSLPKTRSGKIMRRLLRELVHEGKISGDVTTLEDFSILEQLRKYNDD